MNEKKVYEKPIISAKRLTKKFDDFEAVRGVDFYVNPGECFGLLGPNGAGKTSIVKMVYSFSPVTSGKLFVFDLNVKNNARKIKTRLGVISQDDNLDPELSVLENLLIYASYFKIPKEEAIQRSNEILEFMDLTEKAGTAVNNLSGGMKRRLTLGRALLNHPELIILDEPTTGLDPYARHILWQRLRQLKESGTTMLLTTHYLEEASQLCDRLVILYQGKILEEGSPQELIDLHVGKEVLELGINPNFKATFIEPAREFIKSYQVLGGNLLLFTNQGEQLSNVVNSIADAGKLAVNYKRLRPTNLEDVFLKLTGETLNNLKNNGDEELENYNHE